jgi:hypothetical protein
MLWLLCTIFATLLLGGCAGKPVPKKADETDTSDRAVMICCPVNNGFACDWLTDAEDGKEKMALARISKNTGVMSAVCPLSPSA